MRVLFSLFRNDKKTGNQPDFRSLHRFPITITEPGVYKVSGWNSVSRNGDPFIKCWLEKVEADGSTVAPASATPTREENIAMIEKTRQALERDLDQAPPGPKLSQGYKRPWTPSVPPRAEDDDSLPF